jgi:sugar lactone lactonase YvrE
MERSLILLLLLPLYSNAQIITTIAGNGGYGFTGDGVPATSTRLYTPAGIQVDKAGNVYFADEGNARIRMINVSGYITTIAGNGSNTYSGDGGPGTSASVNDVVSVVQDALGNFYISSNGGNTDPNVIRKLDPAGNITTIAGHGIFGYTGDGGPATAAQFYGNYQIALDPAGNLYVADQNNHRVRKINTSNTITTFAGNGTPGFSGDGGPATTAELRNPTGVATDENGNIFFSELGNGRIRKIDASGIITTIAGNGTFGYSGDGGPATAAELNQPCQVATDKSGNVFFADARNYRIRKIDAAGIITTVVGNGTCGFSGDGGPAYLAEICNAVGVAVDGQGNLYIGDGFNNRIRKVANNNHGPLFNGGHAQVLTVCENSTSLVDSLLKATDIDTGQEIKWSVISAPVHGTALAAFSSVSTGSVLFTTGLSYAPATGYVGTDSFKVRVTDGYLSDTTTIHVTVLFCPLGEQTLVDARGEEISTYPNPVHNELTVTSGEKINTITITNLIGQTVYTNEYNACKVTVNVSNFANGLYYITIRGEKGTKVQKFVKM